MKKPKETKKEVDLTTLLTPEQLMADVAKDDCFGREWDPQDADCAMCHDVEICGIVKQEQIKGRTKKLEKEKGPFLDMTAFEKVPIEKMVEGMKSYAADGDPYTFDELAEDVGKAARTKDTVAIREYIKSQLPRYSMTVTPEKTIIPYESTDNNVQHYPTTPEDSLPGSRV